MEMFLEYKMVSSDEYSYIASSIYGLQLKTAKYFNTTTENLRWYHYKEYVDKVLNYSILEADLGDVTGRILNGYAQIIEDTVSIVVNTNKKQVKTRQNFTLMHEISHGYCHLNENKHDIYLSFSELHKQDPRDKQSELQANIWASHLMLSDEAIFKYMELNYSFQAICREFEISPPALFTRLKSFLVLTIGIPVVKAVTLIRNYEQLNDKSINEIITIFGKIATGVIGGYIDYHLIADGNIENAALAISNLSRYFASEVEMPFKVSSYQTIAHAVYFNYAIKYVVRR